MPDRALEDCPRSPHHHLEVASRKHRNGKQHFFVLCKNCYMRGPRKKTPKEAVEAWNALPRALRWTKEAPKKPGLYWWRSLIAKTLSPRLIELGAAQIEAATTTTDCEWAGPVPRPLEREKWPH